MIGLNLSVVEAVVCLGAGFGLGRVSAHKIAAELAKLRADVEGELKKVETSVVAEVKKLVADIRAKL